MTFLRRFFLLNERRLFNFPRGLSNVRKLRERFIFKKRFVLTTAKTIAERLDFLLPREDITAGIFVLSVESALS